MSSKDLGRPHLPMEVILRILKFAMTSPHPILDPLSPLTVANLTDFERTRGNQIAIQFLATCRALQEEGTKILWNDNAFVFTTPEAVRNFADLNSEFRNRISQITFRIIARYYDDQPRKPKLERQYHSSLKKDIRLRVSQRPKDNPLVRGGFRSYTWTQIVDFLAGLRAPYDPACHLKSTPRPKLLPSLVKLRLDLVNFSDSLLPFSGPEFHDITSHELGCTLNELQVTGMPNDDAGMKAGAELSGLLKDEGLYLDGVAAFVALYKGSLQPLKGFSWVSRVVRARRELDDPSDSDFDMSPDTIFSQGHTTGIGALPPAPEEVGHPPSFRNDDLVIWKKVPESRDSETREWILFSRFSGYEVEDTDDEQDICPCCGDAHPAPLLGAFLDDDEDDFSD